MKKNFFISLIFIWIIIAVFGVFYNANKAIFEMQEWGRLSDSQKRHKIFGDLYDFFIQVNNYTEPTSKILVYSTDGMTSGVGRYYVYPRLLIWPRVESDFKQLANNKKYKYIFSYNKILSVNGYEEITLFSSKTSNNFAILYKLK